MKKIRLVRLTLQKIFILPTFRDPKCCIVKPILSTKAEPSANPQDNTKHLLKVIIEYTENVYYGKKIQRKVLTHRIHLETSRKLGKAFAKSFIRTIFHSLKDVVSTGILFYSVFIKSTSRPRFSWTTLYKNAGYTVGVLNCATFLKHLGNSDFL